jgi:hypothetical protein
VVEVVGGNLVAAVGGTAVASAAATVVAETGEIADDAVEGEPAAGIEAETVAGIVPADDSVHATSQSLVYQQLHAPGWLAQASSPWDLWPWNSPLDYS